MLCVSPTTSPDGGPGVFDIGAGNHAPIGPDWLLAPAHTTTYGTGAGISLGSHTVTVLQNLDYVTLDLAIVQVKEPWWRDWYELATVGPVVGEQHYMSGSGPILGSVSGTTPNQTFSWSSGTQGTVWARSRVSLSTSAEIRTKFEPATYPDSAHCVSGDSGTMLFVRNPSGRFAIVGTLSTSSPAATNPTPEFTLGSPFFVTPYSSFAPAWSQDFRDWVQGYTGPIGPAPYHHGVRLASRPRHARAGGFLPR